MRTSSESLTIEKRSARDSVTDCADRKMPCNHHSHMYIDRNELTAYHEYDKHNLLRRHQDAIPWRCGSRAREELAPRGVRRHAHCLSTRSYLRIESHPLVHLMHALDHFILLCTRFEMRVRSLRVVECAHSRAQDHAQEDRHQYACAARRRVELSGVVITDRSSRCFRCSIMRVSSRMTLGRR
jgi:hypothetical protein